mmetsp:Transcript_6028/g.17614  ORF Transcript_6028/g.17614 Transcript_6028/m.17614 type:complete len:342 (-) Transcript_6028:95-1120(-)
MHPISHHGWLGRCFRFGNGQGGERLTEGEVPGVESFSLGLEEVQRHDGGLGLGFVFRPGAVHDAQGQYGRVAGGAVGHLAGTSAEAPRGNLDFGFAVRGGVILGVPGQYRILPHLLNVQLDLYLLPAIVQGIHDAAQYLLVRKRVQQIEGMEGPVHNPRTARVQRDESSGEGLGQGPAQVRRVSIPEEAYGRGRVRRLRLRPAVAPRLLLRSAQNRGRLPGRRNRLGGQQSHRPQVHKLIVRESFQVDEEGGNLVFGLALRFRGECFQDVLDAGQGRARLRQGLQRFLILLLLLEMLRHVRIRHGLLPAWVRRREYRRGGVGRSSRRGGWRWWHWEVRRRE